MISLDRLTLSYFFIALAAFVLAQTVFSLLARPLVTRIELNRRMKLILGKESREEVFAELMKSRGLTSSGTFRYPLLRRFNSLVLQSGGTIGMEYILLVMLAASVVMTSYFMLVQRLTVLLSVPLGITLGAGFVLFYLMIKRRRRRSAFAEQLPDALELIARSLKAGHPLSVSLTLAAREVKDPLGSEFGIMSDELAYGVPLGRALRNLDARVGQEDLAILATAIIIQNEVGGNLIELVTNLSRLLRDRIKLRRKVKTLSSEGRFSGAALSALPFLIFLAINSLSPKYYGEVWDKPIVTVSLVAGLVWMVIGNIVMYRMVNFRY